MIILFYITPLYYLSHPKIWRAQLRRPASAELAHSNMYLRTSGHVMLSSSSNKIKGSSMKAFYHTAEFPLKKTNHHSKFNALLPLL